MRLLDDGWLALPLIFQPRLGQQRLSDSEDRPAARVAVGLFLDDPSFHPKFGGLLVSLDLAKLLSDLTDLMTRSLEIAIKFLQLFIKRSLARGQFFGS